MLHVCIFWLSFCFNAQNPKCDYYSHRKKYILPQHYGDVLGLFPIYFYAYLKLIRYCGIFFSSNKASSKITFCKLACLESLALQD